MIQQLADAAWKARENAYLYGKTAVGAAALSIEGNIHVGCNIEHRFRAHDIHAETNALSAMAAAGDTNARHVLIVAERVNFTPCGGCLDWIFELGGGDCRVSFQGMPNGPLLTLLASELMPHYPS